MIWIVFTLIELSFIFLVYGLLSEFIDGAYLWLAWIVVSWVNFRFSSGYPLARMAALFAITLSHGCLIGFLLNVLIEKIELTFMACFGGMIIGILCGMVVVTVILAGLTALPTQFWLRESTLIPPFQLLAV